MEAQTPVNSQGNIEQKPAMLTSNYTIEPYQKKKKNQHGIHTKTIMKTNGI
jgi:hypothetical protein